MKKITLAPSMTPPFSVQLEVMDAALPYTWDLYADRSDVSTWNPPKLQSGSQDAWCNCPSGWPARGHILQWQVAVQTFDSEPVKVRIRATLKDAQGRLQQAEGMATVSQSTPRFRFALEVV